MSGFNPETGEVAERAEGLDEVGVLKARLESMADARKATADDLHRAELELRRLRQKVETLRAELDERRQEADEMPMAKIIYQGWVKATGRNPKRTKFGPARQKAVLARIREGRDFDYIMRAATIGVQAANVSNRQAERFALIAALKHARELLDPKGEAAVVKTYKSTLGRGVEKYDDLELVCRDEVKLEQFARFADIVDPEGTAKLLDEGV